MKANRKFMNKDDEAVSPVIAVILMVAITVVLAATVYVWVSGFGANSGTPAKSVALSSAGPIENSGTAYFKNYTIASATPGMKYSDITVTVNGNEYLFASPTACGDLTSEDWKACADGDARASTDLVRAGDVITIRLDGATLSGKSLRVLDSQANSQMYTLTIQ